MTDTPRTDLARVAPGGSIEVTTNDFPPNLTTGSQIGVRILDTPTGTVLVARDTTGITEAPAGSGLYGKTLTFPSNPDTVVSVVWDANGIFAREEFYITTAPSVIAPVSGYTSVAAVRQVLAPDGSTSATLGTAASLSDAEIQEAIDEGATEIDARLSSRYTVPFTAPIPPVVEKINRDLAAYMATLVYRRNTPLGQDDPIRLRYARALDILRQIGKGEIDLTTSTGEVTAGSEAAVVNILETDLALFGLGDFSLGVGPFRQLGSGPGVPYDPFGYDS